MNIFRVGNSNFYGKGSAFSVDTSRPFSIVTQFLTHDGTDSGDLTEIRRIYVQDGRAIPTPKYGSHGLETYDSLTDGFCHASKTLFGSPNDFERIGKMKKMGEALGRGMTLALSIWDDAAGNMQWLDGWTPADADSKTPGVLRGPCDKNSGNPTEIRPKNPDAFVKYYNIKVGHINTTFGQGSELVQ
jgi:cellulose 1,4-beta-cellobiosidase